MFGTCSVWNDLFLSFLYSFTHYYNHRSLRPSHDTVLDSNTYTHISLLFPSSNQLNMDSTTRASMDSTKGRASIDSQKGNSQDAGKRRPVC
jgi:hypothetical protein